MNDLVTRTGTEWGRVTDVNVIVLLFFEFSERQRKTGSINRRRPGGAGAWLRLTTRSTTATTTN